jgi:hypothetical protein
MGDGAGALILGKAETGLFAAESSVTMMVGDCSGVGRGRRRGRRGAVDADRREALYRRASLYINIQDLEFENHINDCQGMLTNCGDLS